MFDQVESWESKSDGWIVALCDVKLCLLDNYKPLNGISERWTTSFAINDLTWWEFVVKLLKDNVGYQDDI